MNPEPFPSPHNAAAARQAAREQAAADWVVRAQSGLAPAEQAELSAWMRDPRNASLYGEIARTSAMLDKLRDPVLESGAIQNAPVAHSGAEPFLAPHRPTAPRSWRRLSAMGLAAAAAVAIGVSIWLNSASVGGTYSRYAHTQIGGLEQVKLPDGSVIRLNTDSAINVSFTEAERRIVLVKGEAYFSVAKDRTRPFLVDAGSVAVRAVGTAFSVRRHAASIEVLMTEGTVELVSARPDERASTLLIAGGGVVPHLQKVAPQLLTAGEKALISIGNHGESPAEPVVTKLERPAIESALAWQEGRLQFVDVTLADAVAEFNRHNRHKLLIVDAELGGQRFGGAFAASGYNTFVELLEQSFGVSAERGEATTVLRLKR